MGDGVYLLTTNPGLEDIVEIELRERLRFRRDFRADADAIAVERKPWGLAGALLASSPSDALSGGTHGADLEGSLLEMQSIYHVVRHLRTVELPGDDLMAELLAAVEETAVEPVSSNDTFRVSSKRSGTHPFRSVDIEREAGAVVQRQTGMSVDLEGYTVHVRVDLRDRVCTVGLQLTRDGLDQRWEWRYRPRVALRTVVAYGMLRLARLGVAPQCILDPFCGSGTILLEAAKMYPQARIAGSDKVVVCVEGARENVRAAGFDSRVSVVHADARDLAETWPAASVDAVITNPPFGVRLGKKTDFEHLYDRFLRGIEHVLRPGGRAVFLGGKRRHFVARVLARMRGLRMKHVRVIETGGVYPAVYVLERITPDPAGRSAVSEEGP